MDANTVTNFIVSLEALINESDARNQSIRINKENISAHGILHLTNWREWKIQITQTHHYKDISSSC